MVVVCDSRFVPFYRRFMPCELKVGNPDPI